MAILGEMHGSPNEAMTRFGVFTATRRLRCDWSTRLADMQTLVTWPGHVYPHRAGVFALSASALPAPGEQKGSGVEASYDEAILTVNYSSPAPGEPRQSSDGGGATEIIFSETIEPTTEFLTLDSEGFTWLDNTPLGDKIRLGRLECGFSYVFTRHNWDASADDFVYALSLVGLTNEVSVDARTLGLIFSPETLLVLDPSFSQSWDEQGNAKMSVTFRLAYKGKSSPADGSKGGWNQYWRADTGDYDQVKKPDGTVHENYPQSPNFHKIGCKQV